MPTGTQKRQMQHLRAVIGRRQPPVPVMSSITLVLLCESPAHGYALFKEMCDMGVFEDGVDASAIYPTLKALEAEGFIEPELVDEGAGRRARCSTSRRRAARRSRSSWSAT